MKISGKVIEGFGQSRQFGFPTANLKLGSRPELEPGVFVAKARFDGVEHNAIVIFGAGNSDRFEVHIFDHEGELVGQELEVEIKDRISGLIETDNQEILKEKIETDINKARKYFT